MSTMPVPCHGRTLYPAGTPMHLVQRKYPGAGSICQHARPMRPSNSFCLTAASKGRWHHAVKVSAGDKTVSDLQQQDHVSCKQTGSIHYMHRRQAGLLLGSSTLLGAAQLLAGTGPSFAADMMAGASQLSSAVYQDNPIVRMLRDARISNPGVAWALTNKDRQLFYPSWLEGSWQVTAKFSGASFPQGQGFVSKQVPGVLRGSMIAALPDVGAAMDRELTYTQRFTLSAEEGGVVADRVFNLQQLGDAFLGYPAVKNVAYQPQDNPTRLAVVYTTPRKDQSELREDLRKAELFVNNRQGQALGDDCYATTELYRQVSQAARQGSVADYMIINLYQKQGPGRVAVTQRVAAFLQPQDALFFQANNRAVAVYDYQYTMATTP